MLMNHRYIIIWLFCGSLGYAIAEAHGAAIGLTLSSALTFIFSLLF